MTAYRFPHCIVCDKRCIPLADYDPPVCVNCDDDMARAARVRANFELAPRTSILWSSLPVVTGCGTPGGYVAHIEQGAFPCWPCTHYMELALRNTRAWSEAREREVDAA